MENFNLGMGAHESPQDHRDWTPASLGVPTVGLTSNFMDISKLIHVMQGAIGGCVSCSGTINETRCDAVETQASPEELSWRFGYALCKANDGFAGEGTYPRLWAKMAQTYGVPLAKYCPNDVSVDHEAFVYNRDITKIPKEAFDDAKNRKIGPYYFEEISEAGIKRAIDFAKANRGGVMILKQIGDEYWKPNAQGKSLWGDPTALPIRIPKAIISGHEQFPYGYETEAGTGRLKVWEMNSWGDKTNTPYPPTVWGDNGNDWFYFDEWRRFIVEILVFTDLPNTYTSDKFTYNFTKLIRMNNEGPEVVALQHALKIDGDFPVGQKLTGYYGPITQKAVLAFQRKYQVADPALLTTLNGVQVGPATRAKLNELFNK